MIQNKFKDFFAQNKNLWDERTKIHVTSDFYNVIEFKKTLNSLNSIESDGLGDLSGKKIVHLQCHFGLDTISMAARGAETIGVDISTESIDFAKKLAKELNQDATFYEANVYDVPSLDIKDADIVFCSYGAICWLPDLTAWAEIVKGLLKPGGRLYMAEFHPVLYMVEWADHKVTYPYFEREMPHEYTEEYTYTDSENKVALPSYFWQHSISELLSACRSVGFKIDIFREYDWSPYNCFPNMEEIESGKFQYRINNIPLPHVYELQCIM